MFLGWKPGPTNDRANTLPLSYQTTHSSHQQLFTLNLPRLHFYFILNFSASHAGSGRPAIVRGFRPESMNETEITVETRIRQAEEAELEAQRVQAKSSVKVNIKSNADEDDDDVSEE